MEPQMPSRRPPDEAIPDGMSLLYADLPEEQPESLDEHGRGRLQFVVGAVAAGAGALVTASRLGATPGRGEGAHAAWSLRELDEAAAREVGAPTTVETASGPEVGDAVAGDIADASVQPAPELDFSTPPPPVNGGSSANFGIPVEGPPSPGTGAGVRTITADPIAPVPEPQPADAATTPPIPPVTTSTPPDAATSTTTTTLPPPLLDLAHAQTVAGRATFGATPAAVGDIEALGLEAWIDRQLEPASIPDPAADAAVAGFDRLDQDPQQIVNDDARSEADAQVYWATVARSLVSERQLFEVMVQFWREHFTVITGGEYRVGHDRYIRQHALGRFEDLLMASAHDPAMLYYLDNARSNANRSGGVNENYGRELLELHTLGIMDGAQVYTEDDIRAAAEVMSGWSVERDVGFVYRDGYHFSGPVSLLNGGWSTPGRPGPAGYDDGRSLLVYLAHHGSTARYVAWKLCRFFVDENPSPAIVSAAAATYQASGTDIAATVRTILTSQELRQSGGARAKRGYEWVLSALRTLGATAAVAGEWNRYDSRHVPGLLRMVGHEPYAWSTPDGYPVENEWWMSSWGVYQRWYNGRRLVDANDPARIVVNLTSLLPVSPLPASTWVSELGLRICGLDLTGGEVAACVAFLGVAGDTVIDQASIADPGDIIGLVMSMPSFQRRG